MKTEKTTEEFFELIRVLVAEDPTFVVVKETERAVWISNPESKSQAFRRGKWIQEHMESVDKPYFSVFQKIGESELW